MSFCSPMAAASSSGTCCKRRRSQRSHSGRRRRSPSAHIVALACSCFDDRQDEHIRAVAHAVHHPLAHPRVREPGALVHPLGVILASLLPPGAPEAGIGVRAGAEAGAGCRVGWDAQDRRLRLFPDHDSRAAPPRLSQGGSLYRPADPDSLSLGIAASESIEVPSLEYDLLSTALERVLRTYAIVGAVQELAETPFPSDGSADGELKELWRILKPEAELPSMSGKHWQEIGFQNVSPATDFRGVGMLGLQAFLYFSRTYRDRAAEIVEEAVGGGESWYPLALASIHLTAFALDLATSRDLQLFLLRSVQTRPETTPAASSDAPTKDADLDIEPFLRIASDLLLLFHSHWRQGGFTVMQFEQTSKSFQAALRPWIRRGILDGRALGWETWDEGAVKLE
ncbi:ELMO/CED-12 family-domain-containing protein [Rhodotorula toruloides]